MRTRIRGGQVAAVAGLALAMACGGDGYGGNPNGPSGGGQSGATITVGASGAVSPAQVTINVGQTVTFTNNSNRTRNIFSDPHGSHTDCPAINSVNQLAPGQTKQTATFSTARSCGFHDHDQPDDAGLKGTIVVR